MNILFLFRQLNYGGAERQLVALAREMRRHGHQVTVAVFYPGGPLENGLREAGVPVCSLNKRGRWDICGFMWRLVKLVYREQPDILHGYLNVQNILAMIMGFMFRRMRVAWGVRASNIDLSKYDWLARVLYRVECRLSHFADVIIVNSSAGLEYAAANGFPRGKMILIPNGIDTDRFRPDEEARFRVRAEWGIDDEKKLIGIVARLDPMKDHPTFIQAASFLAKEQEDVAFVCVGAGRDDYRQQLIELSDQLDLQRRLIWAGARDDVPAVYNALDVLVSCSASEGFSNVIAEAMATGLPCIVTDVGDSAIIVGELGEIVSPRDPQALKTALAKCLGKLRLRDRERQLARQRIIEQFSIKQLEARTEAILLQVCGGGRIA